MHDISAHGRFLAQRANKIAHDAVFGLLVHADAVFYRNLAIGRGLLHGVQAVGNQAHIVHQTRAKRAFLHARAGAAAVEVDFIVLVLRDFFRRLRQLRGVAAAQL